MCIVAAVSRSTPGANAVLTVGNSLVRKLYRVVNRRGCHDWSRASIRGHGPSMNAARAAVTAASTSAFFPQRRRRRPRWPPGRSRRRRRRRRNPHVLRLCSAGCAWAAPRVRAARRLRLGISHRCCLPPVMRPEGPGFRRGVHEAGRRRVWRPGGGGRPLRCRPAARLPR